MTLYRKQTECTQQSGCVFFRDPDVIRNEASSLVVGEHVIKCVIELIRTLLDLQLLSVDLILNVINPLVQLGDVHLSIFKSGLSDLELVLQGQDLLHQLLLSLQGLLSRLLKLLHVLTNSLQFLLNSLQVLLSQLSPLKTPLELTLLDSRLSAELIKLLLIVHSHLDGGPEVLVQLLNGDFIIKASVLNNLDSLQDLVSILRSNGKLGDSVAKVVSRLLVLLLHQHDSTGKGSNIGLNLFVLLVSLLQRLTGLGQLVIGLIIAHLKVLNLLAQISDVAVRLVSAGAGLPGGLLEGSDGGIQLLCLSLQRLHLLSDGIHFCFLSALTV